MHKHYFYEIIYQLTGTSRPIINNMDISMEKATFNHTSKFLSCGRSAGRQHNRNIIVNQILLTCFFHLHKQHIRNLFQSDRDISSDINYIYPLQRKTKSFRNVEEIVLEDINKRICRFTQKLLLHVLCIC